MGLQAPARPPLATPPQRGLLGLLAALLLAQSLLPVAHLASVATAAGAACTGDAGATSIELLEVDDDCGTFHDCTTCPLCQKARDTLIGVSSAAEPGRPVRPSQPLAPSGTARAVRAVLDPSAPPRGPPSVSCS